MSDAIKQALMTLTIIAIAIVALPVMVLRNLLKML